MCGFGKSLIPTYLSAEVAVVTTLDEVPGLLLRPPGQETNM